MNYDEALSFIHKNHNFSAPAGLCRIRELCSRLGDPQKELSFIHVAGTNGKGSTVTMLSCALEDGGYTVGSYMSPYVFDFRERISVNGKMIEKERLAALTERVAAAAEGMDTPPTEFEIVTAVAFLYFKERKCDRVVLETGLGGRLDATNVIENPLITVICSISLDHTEILGDTIEKIAFEKAGIIKPGCPCALYPANPDEAVKVIKDVCRKQKAELITADRGAFSLKSGSFEYRGVRYTPAMYGAHQIYNALTAVITLTALGLPTDKIASGIARARVRGRYEIISEKPRIALDAGHNRNGIDCLIKAIRADIRMKSPVVIFGMMKDKDYPYAIRELAQLASAFICVTPESPRALDAKNAREIAELFNLKSYACDSFGDAAALALDFKRPIVVCGSFYIMDGLAKELKARL